MDKLKIKFEVNGEVIRELEGELSLGIVVKSNEEDAKTHGGAWVIGRAAPGEVGLSLARMVGEILSTTSKIDDLVFCDVLSQWITAKKLTAETADSAQDRCKPLIPDEVFEKMFRKGGVIHEKDPRNR